VDGARTGRRQRAVTGSFCAKLSAGTRSGTHTPAQKDLGLGFAIRGGLTLALNQLFASHRTIEYHLHKGFIELGITTREHLDRVLSAD
jgi:hypothetical protein